MLDLPTGALLPECLFLVARVIHTIENLYRFKIKRVHNIFQTSDVEAELIRIGATLVMRVDTAYGAEIVFGRSGIELIEPQLILAPDDLQTACGYRCDDGGPASTQGTGAMMRFHQPVGKEEFKLHRSTVACCLVKLLVFHKGEIYLGLVGTFIWSRMA
jgi:hypothetical protein